MQRLMGSGFGSGTGGVVVLMKAPKTKNLLKAGWIETNGYD